MEFLLSKVQWLKKSELSSQSRCKGTLYWFTEKEEAHVERVIMRLPQISRRQLKMGLLDEDLSELMEPLYLCKSTSFAVSGSGGNQWRFLSVILSY